jgi:NADPH-dependent 2,4-dienoyl-CoA reductase/sulfur reductase-like enzyme
MNVEQVIVVGAGIAGCSAALEAAHHGLRVTLIDEHPQTLAMMSLDTPYFYGARLSPVLSDSSAVADRILGSNDRLLECLEADVNVLTNTCVWGSYTPGPNSHSATEPQLGLADADRSWVLTYKHLILAPGARDLILSFPGWQLPGVLGANGATALLGRYQALAGSRMVILGSGNTGLTLAKHALERGIEVAAIVDVTPHVRGDPSIAAELRRAGVPFLLSHVIQEALGQQEVRAVRLRRVDHALQPESAAGPEIACDTVCMAFGLVPNIELPAITGCTLQFDASLGGWIPRLDSQMRTSLPSVYVCGDGAGISESMLLDSQIAAEQGRRAARAIAAQEGLLPAEAATTTETVVRDSRTDTSPAQEWLKALVATGGLDVVVCQCEEATRRDLLEVRPPRYLGVGGPASSTKLSTAARVSQDILKRLTRVGMGHCQGKRCRDQTVMLLADAGHVSVSEIVPGSYRAPVRPLSLNVIAAQDETEAQRSSWPTWFHPVNEGEIG